MDTIAQNLVGGEQPNKTSSSPSPQAGGRSIEDILFADKVIGMEQLSMVKLEAVNTGKNPAEILKDRGFATDLDITKARSKLFGISFVDLSDKVVLPEVLALVPEQVAQSYLVMPFDLDKGANVLSVAMADPLDLAVISFLEKKSGKKIKPFIAPAEVISSAIEDRYSIALSSEVSAALKETPQAVSAEPTGEVIKDAPVTKIVASLMDFALKSRATDIHIEPMADHTRVRYRVDGILNEKLELPTKIHDSLVSRVKIMSNLKIDEKRIPQDGRFSYQMGEDSVDVRVATLPTAYGEKVELRLLPKGGGVPALSELGLRGLALKNLEISILRPHGIIIICGPTGSGKTTTLYSILTKINSTKVNIVTVEDPIEYQIGGINQVQINSAAGVTFATALRAFLRQDPNVILVGEIRDKETDDLAVQAALTGHLVFSTLHTSNASGAIPRLLDLGAEPFLLTSALNAVVGQRILRRICPSCRQQYTPPEIMVADIKNVLGKLMPADKPGVPVTLFRGKGCQECGGEGFLGRMGIFEVLQVSDRLAKSILSHADAGEVERQAVEEGMITMKQDGYLKALEGITTIEEVLRVAQD